jgi:hypothetical protein
MHTNPCGLVDCWLGMVNEMVSVEVVDVLMSGGVVKVAWWIRILPSASCFFRSANSSAVRTEEAGGGDAEAGNLFGLSALPNSLLVTSHP